MQASKFSKLIEASDDLTLGQRRLLLKRLEEAEHRQQIVEWIEPQQGKRPVCPYCKTEDPIRWGRSHGLSRFRFATASVHSTLLPVHRWPIYDIRNSGPLLPRR